MAKERITYVMHVVTLKTNRAAQALKQLAFSDTSSWFYVSEQKYIGITVLVTKNLIFLSVVNPWSFTFNFL